MKVLHYERLPKGQRRCIRCKEPYLVGSSPVTRYCFDCYSNPKVAKRGFSRCTICKKEVSSSDISGRRTCSKECTNILQKRVRNTLRGRLNLSLQKARKRRPCFINIDWLEEQWQKQQGKCYYTGWKMDLNGDKALKPTLERIDSSKDYTEGNTVICCRQVNWAKNDYSLSEFFNMCKAVVKNKEKLCLT